MDHATRFKKHSLDIACLYALGGRIYDRAVLNAHHGMRDITTRCEANDFADRCGRRRENNVADLQRCAIQLHCGGISVFLHGGTRSFSLKSWSTLLQEVAGLLHIIPIVYETPFQWPQSDLPPYNPRCHCARNRADSGRFMAFVTSVNSRSFSAPSTPLRTSQFEAWSLRNTVRLSSSACRNCAISANSSCWFKGSHCANAWRKRSSPWGKLTTRVARNSGWVRLTRRAELAACCCDSWRPPRPLSSITERLMPAAPSLSRASRVDSNVSPLLTLCNTSSSPDSAPT